MDIINHIIIQIISKIFNNNNNIVYRDKQQICRQQVQIQICGSISLMNTDNVMVWWWSLSFVLFRYLMSSLSFRLISFYIDDNNDMTVINYLYGTLTPNLLSLIIAMKYNIYISFITISYMISIILYPIIGFCGLLLFTGLGFDTMKQSVQYVIYSVQICSVVSAF